MLNPDDEMKAALLIREMRGWAKRGKETVWVDAEIKEITE